MEIDINITDILDILREVITFLECLRDAQLPLTLESLKEKLLIRLKNTLSVYVTTMTRTSSPEPYLNMKSGPRSLLLRSEADSEEYIGMCVEEQKRTTPKIQSRTSHTYQDHYETFENECQTASLSVANEYPEQNDEEQTLIGIYKNLSATQIKSKCHKCGPLYKKEEKKLFLSETRACWIALIGSHLLIFRSERHSRPYAIYSIRGYMARPAPNMIPRDRRKSESAFEMYNPGNETLQFIARTPKDRERWIAKICEVGCSESERSEAVGREKKRHPTVESSLMDHRKSEDEATRHQDTEKLAVGCKSITKVEKKSVSNDKKDEVEKKDTGIRGAPPLPARIPRRLPSLPPAESLAIPSYRPAIEGDDNNNDDDDDDIYHRIEDLRNETCYQNMILSKKHQVDASCERERQEEVITYDDVRTPNECNERNEKIKGKLSKTEEGKSCNAMSLQETYDDIGTLPEIDSTSVEPAQSRDNDASIVMEKEEFYDDVESLISNRRFAKNHVKNEIEISSKLEKKSFLDRVLSKRESPDKSDKSHCYDKGKVSSNPFLNTKEISTYDDVSDLKPNEEFLADEGEELPEYNCPPPPRPIYEMKSTTESQNPDQTQEFYDDVNAYQERNKNQQIILQSSRLDTCAKANQTVHNMTYNIESEINSDSILLEETEHYRSPKSDSYICDTVETEQKEELYDDIALWVDFTARKRDIVGKRESEDAKSISPDKKTWNRFVVNRKSRITNDLNCSIETNKRGGNETGDKIEELPENNGAIKRNTFQKLISRMENSLAKVSARSPSSVSTSKSNAPSNSS